MASYRLRTRRRWCWPALAAAASIGVVMAHVAPADAACPQWKIGRFYQINQTSAQGIVFVVWLRMQQTGSAIHGTAEYYPVLPSTSGIKRGPLAGQGPAQGSIQGNTFQVTTHWSPNSIGQYTGPIDYEGHIRGTTHDLKHPGSKATWHSQVWLTCAAT
jgi:hypothetical protein